MYNYVVYGLGRVGVCAVYDLIKNCEAKSIQAYDPNSQAYAIAKAHLEDVLDPEEFERITLMFELEPSLKDVDVVVNCAIHTAILDITGRCAKAGVPVCDLGGVPAIVQAQREMEPDVPVVADCGISPGISNIMAADMARRGYDQVFVRCGGISQGLDMMDPTSLHYKLVFSPEGLISEYSGQAHIIDRGKVKAVNALSGLERFEDFEGAYTSNNSRQTVEYLLSLGLKDYDYKTLRYPGHWQAVRSWRALGFLRGNSAQDAELADRLRRSEYLYYDPEAYDLQDMLILQVDARSGGRMQHRKVQRLVVRHNNQTGFSAMEQATAWGITIVAYSLAREPEMWPGEFATPERHLSGDYVIEELSKRDH